MLIIVEIVLITYAWMVEQVAPYLQFDGGLSSVALAAVEHRSDLIRPVLKESPRARRTMVPTESRAPLGAVRQDRPKRGANEASCN